MKSGLRTGELCTLQIEDIDFVDRSFQVLDSKQKTLYPLPLDMLTLQLIKDLVDNRLEGYVFTRTHSWKKAKKDKPLTVQEVWHVIHEIGLEAGVKGFKPRVLRQYFAAVWAHVEKKSLVTLQRILRHKSLETTQVYVDKLVFWEDVQREYEGVRNEPFARGSNSCVCSDCPSLSVCKYAPLPEYATGCRFKPILKNAKEV
jgi:integrase